MVDTNNELNTQAAVPAAEAPAQDAPVSEAPAATTSEAPVAEAPETPAPSVDLAEAHELPTPAADPAPVVEPPVVDAAPVKAVDTANTDNVDSLGTVQDAEINGANLGPRGEGVPADALVPDTRSPIEKAQDTTSKVTDNVDSRGEDQGDQPAFGPRGTNAKSSPETFRH